MADFRYFLSGVSTEFVVIDVESIVAIVPNDENHVQLFVPGGAILVQGTLDQLLADLSIEATPLAK